MDITNTNLVIGNTSQLSYYFPANYYKISSRNIDFKQIKNKQYDTIFITFAEQRTFLKNEEAFFVDTNVNTTIDVINKIKDRCNRVVIYSTAELWNNYEGEVSIDLPYKYNYTPYIKSKEILCNTINENREEFANVKIIYPFNFNSPYRKTGFLFSKIFDSLINKTNNIIGDINFVRDLIHPSVIINESIKTKWDVLVGSGELINVQTFVEDLFKKLNLNYKDYITSNSTNNLSNQRKEYFSKIKYSNYSELLKLTLNDIWKK